MPLHAYPHLGVITVDHIVPKIAGGTDRDDNLVTSCYFCNTRKRDLPVEEFVRDLHGGIWLVAGE